MTEALANLIGVLIAGALLGVEIWVVGIGLLAWVVARQGPVIPRVLIVAAFFLGVSGVAYVAVIVLIGALLESII
jgi:hypothetical protein